ncbi:hypothetical protein [Microtetraspora malaysiensis]|uniref:hypothetical protein n=1 Tax=Microtetraspora malaysiensis TaxID=161358 RepID=UPI003D9066C2
MTADAFGVAEPTLAHSGERRIIVEFAPKTPSIITLSLITAQPSARRASSSAVPRTTAWGGGGGVHDDLLRDR